MAIKTKAEIKQALRASTALNQPALFDLVDSVAISGVASSALTAQLTTITHTAPGTPDYAIQDLILTAGASYGFVTKDEGNSVLKALANLQVRVAEIEAILQAYRMAA